MNTISELKTSLYSDDWTTSLDAAYGLAKLNTPDSIDILIEGLQSDDNWIRNASALGIKEAKNETIFKILWNRIIELGPDEEIGTLVFAMEAADCSRYLSGIVHLWLNGNFEVENALTNIMNEQTFILTNDELDKLKSEISAYDMEIEDLNIEYKIIS